MRLDVWLWAARFFKSRSLATSACRAGRVRINGVVAKASSHLAESDKVTWRDALRPREVQVITLLPKRVGAPEAATAFVDLSPALPTSQERGALPERDRGAGRPEKRDRRDLDHLRGYRK